MWEIIIFLVSTFVAPVLVQRSYERGDFRWVDQWLRELWMALFILVVSYILFGTAFGRGLAMGWRHSAGSSPLGYVCSALIGTVIFCGYWWFLGAIEASNENQEPKLDKQKPASSATQQTSQGDNSPNTSIVGNQNVVGNNNKINYNDPKILRQLDEIKKLLQEQNKTDEVTLRKKLLEKYQLGYTIFDLDYQNSVLPYDSRSLLAAWDIDWNVVKIEEITANRVKIRAPDLHSKNGGSEVREQWAVLPKQVGVRYPLIAIGHVGVNIEILAIGKNSIIFVVGLERVK